MARDKHLIVKKYLEENSLVASNVTSFNNFVEKRMQEIVDEVSETVTDDEFEIRLGKIEVGRPEIIEADGSSSRIMPSEARLRNLTYSAPINLEISVKKDDVNESQSLQIGRIPIMVKSNICNTHGLTREELIENYEDPRDPGGYFIVNGNERIMTMAEDLAENQWFIESDKSGKLSLKLFSLRGSYRIPVLLTENKEGIFEASFSRFKDLPLIVLLKALGLTKESDVARHTGKETDSLIVNLYEFVESVKTKEDAMKFIAERANLQGTEKEILERTEQRIDSYLFPHIGNSKEDRMKKAVTLCKLLKQFLIARENPRLETYKDHYSNKRVRLSGDLLSNLLKVNLGILVKDIQYSLQKSFKRKKFFSIKVISKSTLFSHRIESAIATGSWVGERSGITQNMDKTNYLAMISQLQRVSSMLPSDQENVLARALHPTHYGRFCAIETPEGTEIGLRKNLAVLSRISTRININEEAFIKGLESEGMNSQGDSGTDVFLDGKFIGVVPSADRFVTDVREKRRRGELPLQLNVKNDTDLENVMIFTGPGRALRPLIIVDDGVSRLKEEHLDALEKGEMTWNGLIKKGIIEYLDAAEEENMLVSLYEEELTPRTHSHGNRFNRHVRDCHESGSLRKSRPECPTEQGKQDAKAITGIVCRKLSGQA